MEKIIQELRKRKVVILIFMVGLFFGMVCGFFIAPVKKGMTIGSYNGNRTEKKEEQDTFSEDLAMEMGELR